MLDQETSAPPKLSVARTIGALQALEYSCHRLFRITAGWIASSPETAVKCALGRLLQLDAEALDAVRTRLGELFPAAWPVAPVSPALVRCTNAATELSTAGSRIAARSQWHAAHRAMLSAYAGGADPLWDEPGHRLVRRLRELLDLADEQLTDLGSTDRPDALNGLQQALLASLTEEAQQATEIEQIEPPATVVPGRDEGLTVVPSDQMPAPGSDGTRPAPEETLRRILHTIAFCVEISAVDVCSQMIVWYPDLPWDCHRELARQVYDEVRHYELLRRRIHELGGYMGEFPIHIGIWQHSQLGDGPLERLCIQQVIQEGHGLDADIVFADYMAKQGDVETATMFEFIGADEMVHVGIGCRWMLHLAGGDPDRVKAEVDRSYARLLDHAYGPKYPVQEQHRLVAGMTPAQVARARDVVMDLINRQFAGLGAKG